LPSDRRLVAIACVATVACAAPARAQTSAAPPARERAPALVKWGKWGASVVFVGLTAQGISRHDAADAAYRRLTGYCRTGGSCVLGPDGTYADPRSEAFYQDVASGDRAARAWLIAGQAALVGAVALFIVELSYEHGPGNIPYEPQAYVAPGRGGVLVGMRVSLRR